MSIPTYHEIILVANSNLGSGITDSNDNAINYKVIFITVVNYVLKIIQFDTDLQIIKKQTKVNLNFAGYLKNERKVKIKQVGILTS